MSKKNDLTGQRYGRLTVIKEDVARNELNVNSHHTYWICKCDCGKEKSISADSLGKGTKSCGCLHSEIVAQNNRIYKRK